MTEDFDSEAARKGTDFHRLVAEFHRSSTVGISIYSDVNRWFENYQALEKAYKRNITHVETLVKFDIEGVYFEGTFDQLHLSTLTGNYSLVDLKTGSKTKEELATYYFPQMCGYLYGARTYLNLPVVGGYIYRVKGLENLSPKMEHVIVPIPELNYETAEYYMRQTAKKIKYLRTEMPTIIPNDTCRFCKYRSFKICFTEIENVRSKHRIALPGVCSSSNASFGGYTLQISKDEEKRFGCSEGERDFPTP
jgi:hypothetical protein